MPGALPGAHKIPGADLVGGHHAKAMIMRVTEMTTAAMKPTPIIHHMTL
jgi:hypothetical protein